MNRCDRNHEAGETPCQELATCLFAFVGGELRVGFAGLEKFNGFLA